MGQRMALVPSCKALLACEELIERVGLFAVYLNLLEAWELRSVGQFAELMYRLVGSGSLLAELVARKSRIVKPSP